MSLDGNGIDMYDLIPELHNNDDIHLVNIHEHIWIGVIAGMRPSPPVPRRKTNCFTQCSVYLYNGRRVFSMKNEDSYDFYYLPDNEMIFIEKDKLNG